MYFYPLSQNLDKRLGKIKKKKMQSFTLRLGEGKEVEKNGVNRIF
jgi:hypothetical protein